MVMLMRPKGKLDVVQGPGDLADDVQSKAIERALRERSIRISHLSEASRKVMADSESSGWFCLEVWPGDEFAVEKELESHDIENFLACGEAVRFKERGRRKVAVRRPIIGGYILVRCAAKIDAFNALIGIEGVSGIIGGMQPHRMSDKEVNRFRVMADDGRLGKLAADITMKATDKVFVRAGLFVDMKGEVLSVDDTSAVVLLKLGKITLPLAFLEKL